MRVTGAGAEPFSLRLAAPLTTAAARYERRDGFRVWIEATTDDGRVVRGIGAATPLVEFGTESLDDAKAALDRELSRFRLAPDVADFGALGMEGSPAARFAVECALLDLSARAQGCAAAELLANAERREAAVRRGTFGRSSLSAEGLGVAEPPDAVPVAALLSSQDAAALAAEGKAAVEEGFTTLKVKIGVGGLGVDVARLAALRAAVGESIALRVDANGAWSVANALEALQRLSAFRLELCEQPVAAADLAGLAEVKRARLCPIAADEAVPLLRDIERLEDFADVLVLKPTVLGGLAPSLTLARRAFARGVRSYVSSALDAPEGRMALAHLAAVLPDTSLAAGLGDARLFVEASTPAPKLRLGRGTGTRALVRCPVATHAHRAPDATAVVFEGARWTYRAFDEQVGKWAALLDAHAVRRCDRVCVLSQNRPELLTLWFALLRRGAALVPLNARSSADEIAVLRGIAGPRLTLVEEQFVGIVPDAVPLALPQASDEVPGTSRGANSDDVPGTSRGATSDEVPGTSRGANEVPGASRGTNEVPGTSRGANEVPGTSTGTSTGEVSGTSIDAFLDPAAIAAVLFTSGTTGVPKAAQLSVGNFLAAADASKRRVGGAASDAWLGSLPLFHVGGLAMAFRVAAYGAALHLLRRFDVDEVVRALSEAKISHASFVPTMLQRLLRGSALRGQTLRAVLVGGGPVSRELIAHARAQGIPALQTYGLTEACSQVCTELPDDADGTTAGPPLEGIEVRIVDSERRALPAGAEGDIEVRGPTVMRGYLDAPPVDGWLRTYDLGSLDERGRLRVFARRSDLILSGGENVYPAEIEAVLARHPAVQDVGVAPVSDPEWGQVPVVAVVLCEPVDLSVLAGFCRHHLARFKVPSRIVEMGALPRNANGKLDRRALKKMLGD